MRRIFGVIAVAITCTSPASAQFIGRLELVPQGCEQSGKCTLAHDFGYRDPKGVGWQAKAGLVTDGASIPAIAQPIIGSPWDPQFVRAAVLHDHYCIRTVYPRTQTHRMFYDALIESGVNRVKASVMYYAVMVGSHMWIKPMEGERCSGMSNCIRNVEGRTNIGDAVLRRSPAGELQIYRAPRFDNPAILEDIRQAQRLMEAGDFDTPEKVEALAKQRHPNDLFLQNGDTIRYEGQGSRYPDR